MFDSYSMRSQLEEMERATEESLCNDASFYEVLQALKWEIDADPQIRSIVTKVKATGSTVFISFVPHIDIRVRTADRTFSLNRRHKTVAEPEKNADPLAQELHAVACDVITKSACVRQLNALAGEVLESNRDCHRILRQFERAEYKVLISVGISSYAQVRNRFERLVHPAARNEVEHGWTQSLLPLSNQDVAFLRKLGISVEDNQTHRS